MSTSHYMPISHSVAHMHSVVLSTLVYFICDIVVHLLTIAPWFDFCPYRLALFVIGLILTAFAASTLTLVSRVGILSSRP